MTTPMSISPITLANMPLTESHQEPASAIAKGPHTNDNMSESMEIIANADMDYKKLAKELEKFSITPAIGTKPKPAAITTESDEERTHERKTNLDPKLGTELGRVLHNFLPLKDLFDRGEATYYDILGVSLNAKTKEIKRARNERAMQFHDDKNRHEGARICYDLIEKAYDTLKDSGTRKAYDNMLQREGRYKVAKVDDINRPDFAPNAFLATSPIDDDSPDGGSPPTTDSSRTIPHPPSAKVERLLNKATQYVRQYLQGGDEAKKHIKETNRLIQKNNISRAIFIDAYNINLQQLDQLRQNLAQVSKRLSEKKIDDARVLSMGMVASFSALCAESKWPSTWPDIATEILSTLFTRFESTREMNSLSRKNKSDLGLIRGQDDVSMVDALDNYGEDVIMSDAGIFSKDVFQPSRRRISNLMTALVEPGKTLGGQKILGHLLWPNGGCTFIVATEGANPITWVSGKEVGETVKDAYKSLPSEQKNNIRDHMTTYGDEITAVTGYACKGSNKDDVPPGVAQCLLKSGRKLLMTFKNLKPVVGGKIKAKEMILDFYKENDLPLPFIPTPQALRDLSKSTLCRIIFQNYRTNFPSLLYDTNPAKQLAFESRYDDTENTKRLRRRPSVQNSPIYSSAWSMKDDSDEDERYTAALQQRNYQRKLPGRNDAPRYDTTASYYPEQLGSRPNYNGIEYPLSPQRRHIRW
ncbi:hypothetical protein F4821DRAFT_276635 [Hypoxylon rubiginosum]|uniref:Uncharacterized protein n=1 Tax=Hypoxylon rubiginosum TaxID=110542 RepID=A0ACC0CID0_9PEZI|nr:hypothetical protein F4821DRAFT_276635 [Hypoxylon rubiginosum]